MLSKKFETSKWLVALVIDIKSRSTFWLRTFLISIFQKQKKKQRNLENKTHLFIKEIITKK